MAEVDRGYLLIADIGGYTAYLAAVELEHAHDVLAYLIGVIAATLGASFTVDTLEGDAVFAHRSGDLSADQLVELLQARVSGCSANAHALRRSTVAPGIGHVECPMSADGAQPPVVGGRRDQEPANGALPGLRGRNRAGRSS